MGKWDMGRNKASDLAMTVLAAAALAVAATGQASAAPKGARATASAAKSSGAKSSGAKAWTPKTTPWGDPDLRGTWPLSTVGRTPLQRPEKYGDRAEMTDEEYAAARKAAADAARGYDREDSQDKIGQGHWLEPAQVEPLRRTSLIVEPANGRIPEMTPAAKAKAKGMRSSWSQTVFDGLEDFNPLDRCITRGMPASMLPFPYNNGVRIFQAPGYVAIQLELIHETRIIPLDGRTALPGTMKTWLGASRGHFEGRTLVIETTNFNGESPMVIVGPTNQPIPTSTRMRIVERLTPAGPDRLDYEARVEDPEVLTGPWKMAFPWTRDDGYKIFEYACHEGNTAITNYIHATSPRFAGKGGAAAGR